MGKRVLLAVLAIVAMTMQAKVDVEVSETVELMSILSRTAGYEEYNMDWAGEYINDVEAWFAPFKDHSIISYYQGLRENYQIAYNAPASLAVSLEIDGGKIKMVGMKENLDKRWNNVDLNDFITRLNQFYTDTRFHEFFEQHKDFYQGVLNDYRTNVMRYFNQDWYNRFYGTEQGEKFRVIIGFINGGCNYGANRQIPGKPKEIFSICGYWIHPQMGSVYSAENAKRWAAPTLIHEFNHSFVNPIIDDEKNAKLLGDVPQRLFEQDENTLSQQAYTDGRIVFNESIVRAGTIIYLMENGFSSEEVRSDLMDNMTCGFKWMPELVTALRDYASQRSKYPTLSDFYPQVAKVLKEYLDTEDQRISKILELKPSPIMPSTTAGTIKAEVMETVELMGILSRLAGFEEYNSNMSGTYPQDVDQWFASFKQHPIINYYQGLRRQYSIAYDAPVSLGVRLSAHDGKIVKLNEEAGDCGLDNRWNHVDMDEFLNQLNQFYTDTRFHDFFVQHQSFYQEKLQSFNDIVMPYVHLDQLDIFYGKQSNHLNKVILGFATSADGGYGAARHLKDKPWERFAITGIYTFDPAEQNQEEWGNSIAGMITGTLNMSAIQSEAHQEKSPAVFSEIGDKLMKIMNNHLWQSNYGFSDGQAVVKKSIDWAAEIINMMENGSAAQQVRQQLSSYLSEGFTWMPELVTALCDYSSHRNKYPTIDDFYPQIAKVMNKYLDNEQKRFDKALK